MLRYAYQRQYYTDEKVIRIVQPSQEQQERIKQNPQEQFVTINQRIPATDPYGNTVPGESVVLNDIAGGVPYDITVEESVRSSSHRLKTQAQIAEMLQSNAAAQDPEMSAFLFQEWVNLSDVSEDTKAQVKQHSTVLNQKAAMEQQQNSQVAQAEQQAAQQAEATKAQTEMGKLQQGAAKLQIETQKVQSDAQLKREELMANVASKNRELDIREREVNYGMVNGKQEIQKTAFEVEKEKLDVEYQQLKNIEQKQRVAQNTAEQTFMEPASPEPQFTPGG
jgi:hypothetical protein